MKRGPKSLLTPKLQKKICDLLANCNTILTACHACGIGEKTYFRWCELHPTFLTATREARARAKIKLVNILSKAALKNPVHAAWILERSWPSEYSRVSVERVEEVGEKADAKKFDVNILYSCGNRTFAELTDFPNLENNSPEVAAEKQRRLTGESDTPAEAQAPISLSEDDSAPAVVRAYSNRR